MSNEEIEIYGQRYAPQSAWAWRRLPDVPDWHVYVQFGDDGYECDPGVYGESIESAVAAVSGAIEAFTEMLEALKKFQAEGVKPDGPQG